MHWQMYYTSCEQGLSGYAGFQFNAVTPSVSDEVLRRVEALTLYEPPASIGPIPSPEQVASCPVNLCHDPGEQPVVARVSFAGSDYSGRFGNYFAHALLSDGPSPTLPIELWDSPLWSTRESPATDLPMLADPLARGPLSHENVASFVAASGHREMVPVLLAAVELAVTGGERSVVVYDRDASRVAHWIAVVSYLLPPPMVRRMSFATYQHRPANARQHVIGTVPDADFEPSPETFAGFYLFDFVNGMASHVPDRPATTWLAEADIPRVASLWRSAANLCDGDEQTLDDWHPVLLAARVLTGETADTVELGPLPDWLAASAPRLPNATVERIGRTVLDGARDGHDLTAVVRTARTAGVAALHVKAEIALVDAMFEGRMTDTERPRSPEALSHAQRLCRRSLDTGDVAELARVVGLAVRWEIALDPGELSERGRTVVGPALAAGPPTDPVRRLLRNSAPLRDGALAYLSGLPFDHQIEILTNRVGGVFPERELTARPDLRRAALIVASRAPGADRVATVLKCAGDGTIELELLRTVWPSGASPEESAQLIVGARGRNLPADWLEDLAMRRINDAEAAEQLFGALTGARPDRPLTPSAVRRVQEMGWALEQRKEYARSRSGDGRVRAATVLADAQGGDIDDYLALIVPGMLLALRANDAVRVLTHVPPAVRDSYLASVDKRLTEPEQPATGTLAKVWAVAWTARRNSAGDLADEIERTLVAAVGGWGRRELRQVGGALRRDDARIADSYDQWCEAQAPRRRLPRWMSRD